MSTRVWAVTEGSYSDYRVRALFTSKKLAEQHRAAGGGDDVEEFYLYDELPKQVVVYSINARIWPDGKVTSENTSRLDTNPGEPEFRTRVEWDYGPLWGPPKPIREARTLQAPYAGKDWLVRVDGTDKARVKKAFDDRIAEARARALGISA